MEANVEVTFTVFTPTYNRARLLKRAYESLNQQTFRDFEWVVVDDGSIDNTGHLVQQLKKESNFPIQYIWQPNSGKHVAINKGVTIARGRYFVILDSDDWLVPTALETIFFHWESMPASERDRFVGIAGLCAYPSGKIIGTTFPCNVFDSDSIEIRTRYKVKGEKFGMNRTDVLKKFPFPENIGNFIPESLIWNRIAKEYKTRFINEVLVFKEFQPGGLTDRSIEIRVSSSEAVRLYYREYSEITRFYASHLDCIKACANYVRFSLHGKVPLRKQYAELDAKLYLLVAMPLGFGVYFIDKVRMIKKTIMGGKL